MSLFKWFRRSKPAPPAQSRPAPPAQLLTTDIEALKRKGDITALRQIIQTAQEEHVVRAALVALAEIDTSEARESLFILLGTYRRTSLVVDVIDQSPFRAEAAPILAARAAQELDPDVRKRAFVALQALDKIRAVTVAFELLRSDVDSGVRLAMFQMLGDRDDSKVAAVEIALEDAEPYLRELAAKKIEWWGSEGNDAERYLLLKLASHQDSRVRWFVTVALTRHAKGWPQGLDALIGLLEDPNDSVRSKAVEAFELSPQTMFAPKAILDARASNAIARGLAEGRLDPARAVSALRFQGADLTRPLSAVLASSSAYSRMQAVRAATLLPPTNRLQVLSTALQDSDREVRLAAAESLASLEEDGVHALLRGLTHPVSNHPCYEWLRRMRHAGIANAALGLLTDSNEQIRHQASALIAEGCARFGATLDRDQLVPALLRATADESKFVRAALAEALGHLCDPRSAERLRDLKNDPEEHVQRQAAAALEKLR